MMGAANAVPALPLVGEGVGFPVWPIEQGCAVGKVINDRRNWMRVKLVVNAFLPKRVDHTKILVFENDLIDIRVPLVRGWRVLRHGG